MPVSATVTSRHSPESGDFDPGAPCPFAPFPRVAVESLPEQVQDLVVPEMNMGQLYREVVRVGRGRFRVRKVSRIDGELITPQEIIYGLKRRERK